MDLGWMWVVPDDEKDAVHHFLSHLRASTNNIRPHNSIQGECGSLITYLVRAIPFLYRASMDSNLGRMTELLVILREIMELIRTLMEAEDKARDNLNESNNEEMVQLGICLD